MCGIVGYVGHNEAAPILLEGLARLEYRGYDSAGIALVTRAGELFVKKRAGKLAALREALEGDSPSSTVGLGHTRWATHGRPNDLNAHPHTDCTGDLTVIHNGIIENFIELRAELEAAGHVFGSETDTEAIAHLVEEAYAGDLSEAVRTALRRAHGAYALAVIHKGEPERVVGARMNVPLIVGLGQDEAFLASDVAAVLAHTREVIFLEDGDIADIRPSGVSITDLVGRHLERPVHHVEWDLEAAEKGGYDHYMLKEIHEQPEAIRAAIAGRIHEDEVRVPELEPLRAILPYIDRIELVACGTAAYAAAVAANALQAWTGLPARWNIGSEFRYDPPPLDQKTLVIAVTQSGETADTLAPTRLARERGCPVVAVTNTVGSAITRIASAVLFLQAGPEIAVVATKTYVTQVVTLLLVAAQIAKIRGGLDPLYEKALVEGLRALPASAERTIEINVAAAAVLARQYAGSRGYMYVGRGITYPVALEGALKLKEVSYVHAEGYAAGEL
ncbi:MAG TPA: glutamine--fructose-6-phosphate transaminase (isomerizing), partial [Anaerolineae bacterium]|nr:glutamine--fructose-6-phosphate transaminase (isomerizing) [Anaerolineae bacterium]